MQKRLIDLEIQMEAIYAFIFSGDEDWRTSDPDSWDLDVISLDGTEKVLGHRKIDGSICKIVKTSDGKLVAIAK
jgi:hypothetical protein